MASTDSSSVAAGGAGTVAETADVNMTPAMRYYYRHREEKKAKDLARYHSKPEVIAKKEAREKLKAEKEAEKRAKKEAEKEAKRIEKERIRQEMTAIAEATKRQLKEKFRGGLDSVLDGVPPAEVK
jgi:hypothetical protein